MASAKLSSSVKYVQLTTQFNSMPDALQKITSRLPIDVYIYKDIYVYKNSENPVEQKQHEKHQNDHWRLLK